MVAISDLSCFIVSNHPNTFQELLFCETCDTVFCTLCTGGSHMRDSDDDAPETIDITDGGKKSGIKSLKDSRFDNDLYVN